MNAKAKLRRDRQACGTHGWGINTTAMAFDFLSEKAFKDQGKWQHRTCTYQSSDERWNALRELCDLTYWTHRWIVQEIVVAKNVVLQYHGVRIPLSTVEEVFEKFGDNPWHSQSDKDQSWAVVKHWGAIKDSGPALLCQRRLLQSPKPAVILLSLAVDASIPKFQVQRTQR